MKNVQINRYSYYTSSTRLNYRRLKCKCLKNFEWDDEEQKCVCPPPMEIDEDGICNYPIVEGYLVIMTHQ